MISKMKKLAFLIYHKDYDTFLEQVRNLGVVHVVTKSQGEAETKICRLLSDSRHAMLRPSSS